MSGQEGFDATQLQSMLSTAETSCIKRLDQMGVRPQLYEALKHLVITGNVLLILGKDGMRALGLRRYVVKRSQQGKVWSYPGLVDTLST
ncbi:portal protein [Robbsia andropogonis]|uniref:portal protein n=1 Tax=Robbsia andropogonis TaxID=28092 RepID=UPI003D20BE3F